uniref:Uncharacterized protein n=1 Tax=Anguilla anguilla TaxID=7936 RepID=A0A0E9WH89_ANGAN
MNLLVYLCCDPLPVFSSLGNSYVESWLNRLFLTSQESENYSDILVT